MQKKKQKKNGEKSNFAASLLFNFTCEFILWSAENEIKNTFKTTVFHYKNNRELTRKKTHFICIVFVYIDVDPFF